MTSGPSKPPVQFPPAAQSFIHQGTFGFGCICVSCSNPPPACPCQGETNVMLLRLSAEKQQKEVWSSRLQKWLHERFGVYIEDFRFQPEESTVEAEEPLSAKRWVRVVHSSARCWQPSYLTLVWLPCSFKDTSGRWRRFSPLPNSLFSSFVKPSESRQAAEGQTAVLSCST